MTNTTKKKAAKRRIGRRRWAELVRGLTLMMKTAGSERVRVAAALRLADVLILQEQREQTELRTAARIAEALAVSSDPAQPQEQAATAPDALTTARAFLAKHRTSADAQQTPQTPQTQEQEDGGNEDDQ